MSNIVLNAPLPVLIPAPQRGEQKQAAYDNKILFIFLILMSFLVTLGLVFVSLTKEISSSPSVTIEEKSKPLQTGEYV